MYLISAYFDPDSVQVIQKHIDRTAVKTGNFYMITKQIPPHITVAACDDKADLEKLKNCLEKKLETQGRIQLEWAAIGSFKPHVLFLTPVMNQSLHELCTAANEAIQKSGAEAAGRYKPFGWMPHTTLARRLDEKQMLTAFRVMQANFEPFSGEIVRVGLAKSQPYQDVKIWEL